MDAQMHRLATSALLGRDIIPNLPFEQRNGSSIRVVSDYFGKSRNRSNPTPGPFESPGSGYLSLKVW